MRRPSGGHALVALFWALALSVSASLPLASGPAVPALPEHHAAQAEHGRHGTGRIAGQTSPDAHCHPGIDCFVIVALAPPAVDLPSGPAAALRAARIKDRFQSVTMSPQPPPPRAGALPEGGPMQT